jgi:trans-aconitate methyltransferase
MSAAEVLHGLEAMYVKPDPWHMTSPKEQARFAWTNTILTREFIAPAAQVESILEIGCGEGHQSRHLITLCGQLTGIDLVAQAIERARPALPGVEWVVGDCSEQSWVADGRKFGIVTACEVIYASPDIPKALQLMSQLGRGCLVTYFAGAAHAIERPLRAVPVQGHESFSFDNTTWHAVWWTGA